MLIPKKLRPGDTLALVCPSSPVPQEQWAAMEEWVRSFGLVPKIYPTCHRRYGYLAGTDEERARDLMDAFLDDSVDGILCARGGYGAARMLPLLDFAAIAAHPKFFGGYSDITAIHSAIQRHCGFVTYHCPMASTERDMPDPMREALRRAMMGDMTGPAWPERAGQMLVPGGARGRLAGGNLTLVATSLGTPYAPEVKDKILFLEDIGERPYCIDRMLTQLANAGLFRDAAAVVLGYWADCEPTADDGLTLSEIFINTLAAWQKPVLLGFPCGHASPSASLPLGAMAELRDGQLMLMEG